MAAAVERSTHIQFKFTNLNVPSKEPVIKAFSDLGNVDVDPFVTVPI